MRFKKGYKIKPSYVNTNGIVIFTDGTNEAVPNEDCCKAYGYKYQGGVCHAFSNSVSLIEETEKDKVFNNGDGNIIRRSRGSIISGTKNKILDSHNSFVTGENNEIYVDEDGEYLNNASIIGGKYGRATITGEVVIGGGEGDDSTSGQLQTSIIHLYGVSAGAEITLYAQGDNVEREEIYLPANSITVYEVKMTGLCTGGSAGSAGDYTSQRITGSLLCANNGEITKTETLNDSLGSSGSTGTMALNVDTNFVFSVQATSGTNITVNWNVVVKLYINQTQKVTF